MSVNYGIFKKLLTVDELYELYKQIGDTILTYIDIENVNADKESKKNSMQLLLDLLLISYDLETKLYYKKTIIQDKRLFISELFELLFVHYSDIFSFIDNVQIRYDEIEAKYYTKRNFIELNLSGLLMLLDGMDIIKIKDNYIYFVEKKLLLLSSRTFINTRRKSSLIELKEQLAIQEQLGNEAEIMAMEFEKINLIQNNILNEPERVSLFDVSAGYDIASYMTCNSSLPDKFIEVKSCADESLQFFISKNEIETARAKRNHYFIYLLNRKTNKFTIIQDPYNILFENGKGNWAIEPQLYKIHSFD